MKELSIFIDESGDWGEYEKHSPCKGGYATDKGGGNSQ